MKIRFWPVFGVVVLCMLMLAVGGIGGYVWGYQDGVTATINYATTIIDRIRIDNVHLELNETKIDNALEEMKNISQQLMQRINNINNTPLLPNSTNGSYSNCSGVLC